MCSLKERTHLYHHSVTWILFVLLLPYSVTQLGCPVIADINSTIQLTFHYTQPTDYQYFAPASVEPIASCNPSVGCNNIHADGRYNATNINETYSILTIDHVQLEDEGVWRCDQKTVDFKTNCSLLLIETPSCTISSRHNNIELHIGEEVSLSVEIRNHYCSKPIDFLLKTGNTTEELKKALKVDVTNRTDLFNSTFRVSESHNGSVQLLFVCNDVTESVPCDGVKELIEVDPPVCNIASEGNKSVFYVSEIISITADVENYFCSRSIEYQLQAGQSSEMLTENTAGSKNGSNVFTSIFTITKSHFGSVQIRLLCNNMSKILYCGGIKNLTEGQDPCCDSVVAIVLGTFAGVVFIIAIVILIWYFKKVRGKSSTSPTHEAHDKTNGNIGSSND